MIEPSYLVMLGNRYTAYLSDPKAGDLAGLVIGGIRHTVVLGELFVHDDDRSKANALRGWIE